MQRIWLVRHGLTEWNVQQRYCGHTDVPLSAAGRAQARWLASQLQDRPLAAIYSSDLVRAGETADIIASKQVPTIEVIKSGTWREIHFGKWEGHTYAEIVAEVKEQPSFFTDPEHNAPPGGESLASVLRRVLPTFTDILCTAYAGDVVIVSHGGILRGLLCTLLGMPLSQQWRLHMDHGSLSAIDVSLDEHAVPLTSLVLLNQQHPTHK